MEDVRRSDNERDRVVKLNWQEDFLRSFFNSWNFPKSCGTSRTKAGRSIFCVFAEFRIGINVCTVEDIWRVNRSRENIVFW